MKTITQEEYEKQAASLVYDVMASGDIVRVDCGKAGAFVIMEEPEYRVMRDALEAIMRLGVAGELPSDLQKYITS